jgi:hypothetical protein
MLAVFWRRRRLVDLLLCGLVVAGLALSLSRTAAFAGPLIFATAVAVERNYRPMVITALLVGTVAFGTLVSLAFLETGNERPKDAASRIAASSPDVRDHLGFLRGYERRPEPTYGRTLLAGLTLGKSTWDPSTYALGVKEKPEVIGNAAHAAAGMAKWSVPAGAADKPAIGLTMFGVTTALVTQIREALETQYDCFVFHATGAGGQSMEKLADSGLVGGLIDVTTTEVPDLLFGGVFPCTEDRFGAVARTRLPYVGSVGAVDMVNFGARETVPARFEGRNLYVHNPQVTLMRTTPEENRAVGEWIASRLNLCEGPVRLLLPLGGVSAIDAPGKPFHDPEADEALFSTIRSVLRTGANRQLIELPHNINDPAFAAAVVQNFQEIAR